MHTNEKSPKLMEPTNLIYCSLTIVFLCVNIIFISADYFKYSTDTDVSPVYPVKLTVPSISMCYSIKSLYGLKPENTSSFAQTPFLGMTVKDVFRSVPSANETIKACKYRDFDRDIMVHAASVDECSQHFTLGRYYMQGFTCYRYSPHPPKEYSYHALVNSMNEPRELYHLIFRAPFSGMQVMYPMMHMVNLPREDRLFNLEQFIDLHSMHHISYAMYESLSLPAPYDSRCSPVPQMTCYQYCIDDYYRRFNYISETSLVAEGSSSEDLLFAPDGADLGDLEKVKSSCFNKCNRQACFFQLLNTKTAASYPDDEEMVLVIETINTPTMKVIHNVAFTFFDYVTQVASLLGIWLGVSFISISALLHWNRSHEMTLAYQKIQFYTNFVMRMHSVVNRKRRYIDPRKSIARIPRVSIKHNRSTRRGLKRTLVIGYFIIFKCLSKLLVICLFSWQLFNVVQTYFLYRTTIKFDYDVNPALEMPSLSICYGYADIFNVTLTGQMNEDNYDSYFRRVDSSLNHTIDEVFDQFDAADALDGCGSRDWTDRFARYALFNQSECLKRFKVIKFLANKELCFGIIPRDKYLPYHVSDVRMSVVIPGMIYAIHCGPKLHSARKFHVYLYFADGPPPATARYISFYRTEKHRVIRFSNLLYSISLLPPPYDTRCSQIGEKECFDACISKHLSTINRVSYSVRVDNPVRLKILTYTDLTDEHVYNRTREAEEMCESSCYAKACRFNFTTTFPEGEINLNASKFTPKIMFAAQTIAFPNSKIDAIPVQDFYDLFYQFLCCLSFWLGFSFFALNPASLIAGRKAREANEYLKGRLKDLKRMLGSIDVQVFDLKASRPVTRLSAFRRKVVIIHILSSIGCIIHSWYSFEIYFQYSALIDVHQNSDTETKFFPLICLDAAELLVRTLDQPQTVSNISDPIFKSKVLNRTISSMLADSPKGDEMIQSCQYWGTFARQGQISRMDRLTDRILFETRDKSICNRIYKVSPFLFHNYMCYAVRPTNYTGWTARQMTNVLNDGKLFMKITVKSSFLTRRFSILIGRRESLPYFSSMWAPNLKHVPQYNRYHISYVRYVQSSLPSPYPLEGFVPFLFERCNNYCVNSKFSAHNLTLSTRFVGPSHLKYLTSSHRQGFMMPKLIKSIIDYCEERCLVYNSFRTDKIVKDGDISISVPFVKSLNLESSRTDEIAFLMRGTNDPVITVFFTLRISFFEQLINFGSVIGIWFGLSMMHLARFAGGRRKKTDLTKDSHSIEMRIRQLGKLHTRGSF